MIIKKTHPHLFGILLATSDHPFWHYDTYQLICQWILTHRIKVKNNIEKEFISRAHIIILNPFRDSWWEESWFSSLWIKVKWKIMWDQNTVSPKVNISGRNTGCGSIHLPNITAQTRKKPSELFLCLKKRKLVTTEIWLKNIEVSTSFIPYSFKLLNIQNLWFCGSSPIFTQIKTIVFKPHNS